MTSAPPTLRGEIAVSARQETLQVGYLHAVAAAAGCTLASPSPDVHGTDWNVEHPHSSHTTDPVAQIKVQLKATYQVKPDDLAGKTDFAFTLKNKHLNKLNMKSPLIPRLLVVLVMPDVVENWLLSSPDQLNLRHCAYWVNLAGLAATGVERTTVRVPVKNVFDDIGLCKIMEQVGKGVTPK
jgi:hypothetical protein